MSDPDFEHCMSHYVFFGSEFFADKLGFWGQGTVKVSPEHVKLQGRRPKLNWIILPTIVLIAVLFDLYFWILDFNLLVESDLALVLAILVGVIALHQWTVPFSKTLSKQNLRDIAYGDDYVSFRIYPGNNFYRIQIEYPSDAKELARQIRA